MWNSINRTTTSPSCKGASHTLNYITSSLSPINFRRYTNPVYFNLFTPNWTITSRISKSSQVRFLIVWSSLNYFTVHQPSATNSIHLHFTHTPHWQHLQSQAPLESGRKPALELFSGNFERLKPLVVFPGELMYVWHNSKCDPTQ